jgi:ribonuclease HII
MPAGVLCTGIDEAGLGPLLGPLGIVAASAWVDDAEQLTRRIRKARTGVRDSKEVHEPDDLGPLERMALAAIRWLTGFEPETAADVFALLGEDDAARAAVPWMAGARDLRLPVAAPKVPIWRIEGVEPHGLRGVLVHPERFNATARAGRNKHELELDCLRGLLVALPRAPAGLDTVCDRLGGRRYYRDFLQGTWADAMVMVEDELRPRRSAYRVEHADHAHRVAFCVEGESESPLAAMASCVAKYARELHMALLNQWWCGRYTWLKPTAGYTTDARRWIHQIGEGELSAHGDRLLRRHIGDLAEDGADGPSDEPRAFGAAGSLQPGP